MANNIFASFFSWPKHIEQHGIELARLSLVSMPLLLPVFASFSSFASFHSFPG